jgi:formate dehydrogenase subunit gamma
MLVLVGGVTALSGLILLFPILGTGREIMALSHVAHGITAMVMILVIIGHIYIGSIGMEGALEGMTTGYCDLNWAREHHDWWAQRSEENGEVVSIEQATEAEGLSPGAPKHHPVRETAE